MQLWKVAPWNVAAEPGGMVVVTCGIGATRLASDIACGISDDMANGDVADIDVIVLLVYLPVAIFW